MDCNTDYLIIGKAVKPFGVRGEVKVLPITDNAERFRSLEFIYLKRGSDFYKVEVESVRFLNRYVLLKLRNYDSRNGAESLRDNFFYIDRAHAVKIDESSYYYRDLLGCTVKTLQGDTVGTVSDIQSAGSCDVYCVSSQTEGKMEILIPAIKDVVKEIDIKRKEIVIDVIEGLF